MSSGEQTKECDVLRAKRIGRAAPMSLERIVDFMTNLLFTDSQALSDSVTRNAVPAAARSCAHSARHRLPRMDAAGSGCHPREVTCNS